MKNISKTDNGRNKWLVLFAAFCCRMLSGGYAVSMGVFFLEFIQEFDSGRGKAGWIVSLSGGLMYGAGVPVSFVLQRASERTCCLLGAGIICTGVASSYFATSVTFLIFSFGITTGIGMSFVLASCAAAVNLNFNKGRGAAIAVLESGLTIGGLLFPPLLRVLIDNYGWRGAILCSSAILLNIIPLAILLNPFWSRNPYTKSRCVELKASRLGRREEENKSECCSLTVRRRKLFILYIVVSVTIAIGNAYVYAVIVDMGKQMGYSVTNSTYLVLSLSISNIIGVAIMAGLLKLFWNRVQWLFVLNIILMSVSMICFPVTNTYITLLLAASLYGITAGGLYGTYISIVTYLLEQKDYVIGTGLTCSGYGLGTALSAPVAGWIVDSTGDYNASFYVGAGLCFASVAVFSIALFVDEHRGRSHHRAEITL